MKKVQMFQTEDGSFKTSAKEAAKHDLINLCATFGIPAGGVEALVGNAEKVIGLLKLQLPPKPVDPNAPPKTRKKRTPKEAATPTPTETAAPTITFEVPSAV